MWDYEGMKEAGLDSWTIRECAVNHYESVSERLAELLDDLLEGKYQSSDILKVNAKAIALRLVEDAWECGVETGFTYSVPEFQAYLRLKDEY